MHSYLRNLDVNIPSNNIIHMLQALLLQEKRDLRAEDDGQYRCTHIYEKLPSV